MVWYGMVWWGQKIKVFKIWKKWDQMKENKISRGIGVEKGVDCSFKGLKSWFEAWDLRLEKG